MGEKDFLNGDKSEEEIEPSHLPHQPKKAKLFLSARLTLALMCMFATWNFMFQRLTINFGLVCMVKTPLHLPSNATLSSIFHVNATDLSEFDTNYNGSSDSDVNYDFIEIEGEWDAGCPEINKKIRNGTSKFDEGEFEWSREVQGLILASFYYGFVIAQIPGGWFADNFGAKRGLLWSGLSLSILTILIPPASWMGPSYLVALRVIGGLANGAAMPAISSLSSRWFADVERGLMLGIAYAGFGLATATAYPISAFFCQYTGWPYLFYFAGAIGLLWCALTQFLVYEWPEVHPRIKAEEALYIGKHRAVQYGGLKRQRMNAPWKAMLLSGPVWALLVSNFCCFWVFLTVSMYLPTYLKEVLHLDISENGILSATPYITMMCFHFLIGIGFDRLRKRNLVSVTTLRKIFNTIGTFGATICMILIGVISCSNITGAIFLITASQVLLEFAFMGGFIFSIFEIAPKYASPLTAVMNTFGLVVGLLAPPLVSHLTPNGSRGEWLGVFYLSAGICGFGGIFYLLFGTAELQEWAIQKERKLSLLFSNPTNGGGTTPESKELKNIHVKLINGESNSNGDIVDG